LNQEQQNITEVIPNPISIFQVELFFSANTRFIYFLALLCVFFSASSFAQNASVKGRIIEENGNPVSFAYLTIDSLNIGTVSDDNGYYQLKNVPLGSHVLHARAMGFVDRKEIIRIKTREVAEVNFSLEEDVKKLDELVVQGQSQAMDVKKEAYAVEVLDTRKIQNLDVNMNQLSGRIAGIRVRESGGMGSSFTYSLNGMSGRSVRFFVDGIPMDRFGSAYSINNFPVNLVNRLEFYKGVVPPHFGSDALGGVINLVTKSSYESYLDASYSFGSFNTHRAALSGRWISPDNKWYIDAQGFYNYSDNDYYVWGEGVEIADPQTGRTIQIKTRRFHDKYESVSGKLEAGIQGRTWADVFKVNFLYAENENDIQTGATMPNVFGEAAQSGSTYAPTLYYLKNDLFFNGLDFQAFSSVSWLENHVTDTSSRRYNWLGQVIDTQPTNSEMGSGGAGKSLLTLHTTSQFHQANVRYSLNDQQELNFNYTFDHASRTGEDPMQSGRTVSFKEPQKLTKQVASFAYGFRLFNEKMENTAWVKYYGFSASSVDEEYVSDSLGYRPVTFPVTAESGDVGYGLAFKFHLINHHLLKVSAERSIRIPDPDEMLGDGLFVLVSPDLKPEESINLNVSWLATSLPMGRDGFLTFEPSFFWRDVSNLIQYRVQENRGTGQFINEAKVKGIGGSLDVKYEKSNWFQAQANATYQSMRDGREYIGDDKNLTYKDLLPNTPYLMANGGVVFRKSDWIQDNSEFSVYWDVQYVHQFYLRWPSLGSSNKATIPGQLVNSTGLSYAFHSGTYNVSFACNNIFNEQVYDNYLLQKPGRSFSIKFRTFINKL